MSFKIALLPGDGIGPEVTESAVKIINKVAERFNLSIETKEYLIGGVSYDTFGTPLSDETLEGCYDADAVFLGAVGGPKWEGLQQLLKPEAALLKLRKSLDLFANIRPNKVFNSLLESSSLKSSILKDTDFVVVRELTGGIYFGEPRGFNEQKGFNTMAYTVEEVKRIAKIAFELARKRNSRVCSIDKANVLEVSQFWRNVVSRVHDNYPDIELTNMYVDNAAMQIVRDPKQFDVILTGNIFGDIISDIGGMITGSLGMLPSASIGNKYVLYEPVHGSAPDIAGQNKANPLATILSVAMMFDHSFQMQKAVNLIHSAVEKTLVQGYRTPDIANATDKIVSTKEITDILIDNFEEVCSDEAVGMFLL